MGAFVCTGDDNEELGIYQSSCSCHTAITVTTTMKMPACRGCGSIVQWRLVQAIRFEVPVASWSSSRKSYPPPATVRPHMDSSGE